MGIFYSTPTPPMTEEMYLDELRYRKRQMLASGNYTSTMSEYLNIVNKEIALVEQKIAQRSSVIKCVQCLKDKPIPKGYSLCDECLLPVVSYHYATINQ